MSSLRFIVSSILLALAVVSSMLCSCGRKDEHVHVTKDSFADFVDTSYRLDEGKFLDNIHELVMSDSQRGISDIHARRHYLNNGGIVWMTRCGVSSKADSLLAYVAKADSFGFSPESFYYSTISKDLERVRRLDFCTDSNTHDDVNMVYARLEYYLTKAFLKYTEGQRFGFINPYDTFNRLDVRDSDSVRVTYRSLYDVPTCRPDKKFVEEAFAAMGKGAWEVGQFLRASYPENPMYPVFCGKLRQANSVVTRRKLACNIERSRWRHGDYPQKHKKYVLVNIPTLHLEAVDGNETMIMRIGFGRLDTKTPLLTSRVKRMDFNPQWVIPKSIVKKSVRQHAGNRAYFDSHNYFVRERKTGKVVAPEKTTSDMLMSPNYMVVQRGGIGNALGRVIFRFDNDYSIFMHDTSNPGVFVRNDRSVSHGCIRVERPYELAVFMLADKDEHTMARMKYSMTVRYGAKDAMPSEDDGIDKNMLVRSLKVEPQVPIFITYYTLYPDSKGQMNDYEDVYGYDAVLYRLLQKYIKH